MKINKIQINQIMKMEKNNQIEIRSSFDFDESTMKISGYAAVFEKPSTGCPWIETMKRGCITEDTLKNSDIILDYNHNEADILARSKNGEGTLELEIRDDGLYFETVLPDTTIGKDVYKMIKRGDLTECSFAFVIDDNDISQRWYNNEEHELCRDIFNISQLFDCAIVPRGAYSSTSVIARNEERAKEEQEKIKQNINAKLDEKLADITKIQEFDI